MSRGGILDDGVKSRWGHGVQTGQEYLEATVYTASPHKLHLLVVEGAIKFAKRALIALEEQDYEVLELSLTRSRDCVAELMTGLRPDEPSEMLESLKVLFAYVYRSLALADPERNPRLIENAIRILELHRETWLELGLQLAPEEESGVPAPMGRSWST